MKTFYLLTAVLVSTAVYVLFDDHDDTSIISYKAHYTPYVYTGSVDPDLIELFKPSIVFDNDVAIHKPKGYYLKFDKTQKLDKTYTVESFLSSDGSFLAIDKCTYDFDGYLIAQNISKFDFPTEDLILTHQTDTLIYDT